MQNNEEIKSAVFIEFKNKLKNKVSMATWEHLGKMRQRNLKIA